MDQHIGTLYQIVAAGQKTNSYKFALWRALTRLAPSTVIGGDLLASEYFHLTAPHIGCGQKQFDDFLPAYPLEVHFRIEQIFERIDVHRIELITSTTSKADKVQRSKKRPSRIAFLDRADDLGRRKIARCYSCSDIQCL